MVRAKHSHFVPRSFSEIDSQEDSFQDQRDDPMNDEDHYMECIHDEDVPVEGFYGRNEENQVDESANWDGSTETEMKRMLREVPTNVLTFVASAFLARMSNTDFERLLISLDDEFSTAASKLWKYNKYAFSKKTYCNTCGKDVHNRIKCFLTDEDELISIDYFSDTCASSKLATYIRIGGHTQICEIVEKYAPEIIQIREELKAGKRLHHNLSSPFFSHLWRNEKNDCIHLSAVLSIDGVCIPGNLKKIWPISAAIVDLPTSDMQKSTNIVLVGCVECDETPSTSLWNSLSSMVFHDVENHTGKVGGLTFKCHITTLSADQPAKRSFFGMRAHQSCKSCFFCLSEGTWYKQQANLREVERPGELTCADAKNGQNGFGRVPAEVLKYMYPFETPIDILHNLGEGLYEKLNKELMPPDQRYERHSDMFFPSAFQNISVGRNGTDKTSRFRILSMLSALVFNDMDVRGRCVIVALGLVGCQLYTNSYGTILLDEQCCAAARWFLSAASNKYFSIKAHEVLFHLPAANRKFGNCAPLSTFCFESFYQFSLMGYSSSITRYFLQNACCKFLLHTSIRREIAYRAVHDPSPMLKKFIAKTPGLLSSSTEWTDKMRKLQIPESSLFPDTNEFFGKLRLGVGTLTCNYIDKDTTDDFFFAKVESESNCYRFVAVVVDDDAVFVLAEPVIEISEQQKFESFSSHVSASLTDTDLYYGLEIVQLLKLYHGIKCGRLSGKRVAISVENIEGIAAYLVNDENLICLQLNGAFIHN